CRDYISLLHAILGCYSCSMNKNSVKTKRLPAKAASKSTRKAAPRKGAARAAAAQAATVSRLSARKSQPISALRPPSARKITASEATTITVAQVTALGSSPQTHKFHV